MVINLHGFTSIMGGHVCEQLHGTAISYLASQPTGLALGSAITGLVVSICFAAIGSFVVFDIFGMTSKSRENNTGFTSWGRWVRRNWDLPDPYMLVGRAFICFGVVFMIFSVIDIIVALIR
jgi:hypothetical protein